MSISPLNEQLGHTKERQELQTFVNQRLVILQKEGLLKTLSQGYFGDDFVSQLH